MMKYAAVMAFLWMATVTTFAQPAPAPKQPPAPPPGQMKHEGMPPQGMPMVEHAVCVLNPAPGSNARGTVMFDAIEKGGVRMVLDMQGLSPGKHGYHVHEFGDCSAPDFASAGGHFNPEHKSHGAPADKDRHLGDMGNITADASGNAHYEWTDPMMMLHGAHSIIGRSVVVHEKEDDLKSQPSGESGARIACGVIGIAKKP